MRSLRRVQASADVRPDAKSQERGLQALPASSCAAAAKVGSMSKRNKSEDWKRAGREARAAQKRHDANITFVPPKTSRNQTDGARWVHFVGKRYLDVPYDEKERAKSVGCKWDADAKRWWCPVDTPEQKIARWIPKQQRDTSPVRPSVDATKAING